MMSLRSISAVLMSLLLLSATAGMIQTGPAPASTIPVQNGFFHRCLAPRKIVASFAGTTICFLLDVQASTVTVCRIHK
ncbi:hypothetical protein HID58_088246 [Brassica napus]|uniref:Uncharacterized protein n=1 Tax=Brassica napus TaxID=3708 RepID=A0ABQ7XVK7_BRANA|nr:hypothetical protein HID58_088246 [Brassica napus]